MPSSLINFRFFILRADLFIFFNESASEIIKSICNSIGGSGGGQVKFAAGSGPKTDEIELIISKLKDTF